MARTINWTPEKLKALVKARDEATGSSFKVKLPGEAEEAEFDVGYARHLIQYLGEEFAKNPDQPRRPYNEGEEGQ
jgi:hypothetical protein